MGKFGLAVGSSTIYDRELFNQIRNVLKLKAGEKIILGDGGLNEALAEITGYGKNSVDVEITKIEQNRNESGRRVVLYCAVLKKENFETVVQKSTEIGIKEIAPIISERTVKLDLRTDRLEKIAKEAAEQSGRGKVPILHEPVDFNKAVGMAKDNSLNLLFDSSGEFFGNCKLEIGNYPLGVWIGPEGGWTSNEISFARNGGFTIINLGKLTLRAETAAIVASALVLLHN
ncbi:MAG: hypothetical protein A2659_04845 [Candidatus Yanofskybacteria bacterium RIFCSPHIGHO2_01_FULL_44_24]|nr:MAG: hypothetical protein A2659_04845 [Candidatus Yanofskybacteria bacterium RIFCSPHIGHO2_01_FULL_44_24]